MAGCMIGWNSFSIVCPALALLGKEMANGITINRMPITRIGQSTLRVIAFSLVLHWGVPRRGVRPLLLRPAVDVQDERVLFRGIEAVGFDDPDLHGLALGASDGHLLARPEVHLLLECGVVCREALSRLVRSFF